MSSMNSLFYLLLFQDATNVARVQTSNKSYFNSNALTLSLMFLQACESEAAIRHAEVALGALDKTSQASRQNALEIWNNSTDTASYYYQYALKEYFKAIKYAKVAIKRIYGLL
jgi:hypothetical protein